MTDEILESCKKLYRLKLKRPRAAVMYVTAVNVRGLPVGLQLHPAQLHAHRALCIVGLVRHGGAERADP